MKGMVWATFETNTFHEQGLFLKLHNPSTAWYDSTQLQLTGLPLDTSFCFFVFPLVIAILVTHLLQFQQLGNDIQEDTAFVHF